MTKGQTKKQTAAVVTESDLDQEIRQRAYALYEERGRRDGRDLDDWLRAESELTGAAKAAD